MKHVTLNEWITALRSGEYEQYCGGSLHDNREPGFVRAWYVSA